MGKRRIDIEVRMGGRPAQRHVEVSCPVRYEPSTVAGPALQGWKNAPVRDATERGSRRVEPA